MSIFMTKTIKPTRVLETKTATLVVLFLTKLLKNAVTVSKRGGGGGGVTTLNYTILHFTFGFFCVWCNSV